MKRHIKKAVISAMSVATAFLTSVSIYSNYNAYVPVTKNKTYNAGYKQQKQHTGCKFRKRFYHISVLMCKDVNDKIYDTV